MTLVGVLITLYFNALDTIDWLVKLLKCGFEILYGINFLLALIVLVWHIVKIKKAYFEIVKKELPEEALNFEVNDFILEEYDRAIKMIEEMPTED